MFQYIINFEFLSQNSFAYLIPTKILRTIVEFRILHLDQPKSFHKMGFMLTGINGSIHVTSLHQNQLFVL